MRFLVPLAIAALSAVPAQAQSTASKPASQNSNQSQGMGGPVVPGVCLLSREAVFANAKVGQAMTERLRVLTQEAQTEVNAERKPIEDDYAKYQAEAAKLTPEQRKTREEGFAARLQPVQAKATQRSREIEATRAKALETISAQFQPVAQEVYRQHGCGLLLDRGSALGGNFTNDLTAQVVEGLDKRMPTITFNREQLPPAPATPSGS